MDAYPRITLGKAIGDHSCVRRVEWGGVAVFGRRTLAEMARAARRVALAAPDTLDLTTDELDAIIRKARAGEIEEGAFRSPRDLHDEAVRHLERAAEAAADKPLLPWLRDAAFFGIGRSVVVHLPGSEFRAVDQEGDGVAWVRGEVVDGYRHGDGVVHVRPHADVLGQGDDGAPAPCLSMTFSVADPCVVDEDDFAHLRRAVSEDPEFVRTWIEHARLRRTRSVFDPDAYARASADGTFAPERTD